MLQDCTFHFAAGQTTFVIGQSGSGKSTLRTLLMRFYLPQAGSICIDGKVIDELNTSWLRNNITVIQQDAMLFNETIKDNITLGHRRPKLITAEDILEGIRLAALDGTLAELPYGLDTRVGANGSKLSGGQSQRVMLARARVRNTAVLILDESTSALDRVTSRVVIDNVRQWRKGLTTILITHDLTQIRDDDFVYVLDHGRVKAEGLRRELTEPHGQQVDEIPSRDFAGREDVTDELEPTAEHKRFCIRPPNLRWKKKGSALKPSFEEQVGVLRTGEYMQSPRALTRASRLTRMFSSTTAARFDGRFGSLYAAERLRTGVTSTVEDSVPALSPIENTAISNSAAIQLRPMSVHPTMTGRAILQTRAGQAPVPSPRVFERSPMRFRAKLGGPGFKKLVEDIPVQISLQAIYATLWANLDFIHRVKLVIGILTVCFRAVLPSVFAFMMAKNFETFYQQTDWQNKALKWTMVQLIIAVLDGVTAFYSQLLLELAARRGVDRLRTEAVNRILGQPMAWFEQDQNDVSSILSVLDRDTEELRTLLTRFASIGLNIIIMMTVAMMWSMISCWKLTLVGLSFGPVIYGLSKTFDWVSTLCAVRVNAAADAVGLVFVETFADIQTVRSFTLEAHFHRKYNRAIKKAYLAGVSRGCYTAVLFGLSESTINFAMAVVIWYATSLLVSYDFSVMPVLTSVCLLILSSAQANVVFNIIPQIASAADSATRLIRLTQLPRDGLDSYRGQDRTIGADADVNDAIQFNDVVFAYPSQPLKPILKGLSFSVAPGQCVAVVGRSGSGKTTIGNLLVGLHRPVTHSFDTAPPLIVFDQDMRSLHLPTVRSLIAVVPQNPFILPGTVWENICYGLEPHTRVTTRQNVAWAATQAAIHDFVLSLSRINMTLLSAKAGWVSQVDKPSV